MMTHHDDHSDSFTLRNFLRHHLQHCDALPRRLRPEVCPEAVDHITRDVCALVTASKRTRLRQVVPESTCTRTVCA
jgi:hypothetical protein